PTVATGAATAPTAGGITLTGSLNPNARSTNWYFEYGMTTGYGSRTATRNAGSGSATVTVAAALTGLAPGTTFHYRLVAGSSGGTVRGADATFTTLGAPAVRTGGVTRLSTTKAVIGGEVDTLGLAGSYWFEYGHTTSYGLRTPGETIATGSGRLVIALPL